MKNILLIVPVFLIGCSNREPTWDKGETQKISPIVAVFMNKPDDYTAFVQKGQEIQPVSLKAPDYNQRYGRIKVYTDVAKDDQMYAIKTVYANKESRNHSDKTRVEIDLHIHSSADLNGGQWEERSGGKFPQTTTGRVRKVE